MIVTITGGTSNGPDSKLLTHDPHQVVARLFAVSLARSRRLISLITLGLVALCAGPTQTVAAPEAPRELRFENERWSGDLDGMLERRMIRVLVPYSRSLYYNDKGRERGVTAELVRDFEMHLNKKYAGQLGKRPVTVYIIPVTRDVLIPDVAKGLGDIAAGNLPKRPHD